MKTEFEYKLKIDWLNGILGMVGFLIGVYIFTCDGFSLLFKGLCVGHYIFSGAAPKPEDVPYFLGYEFYSFGAAIAFTFLFAYISRLIINFLWNRSSKE